MIDWILVAVGFMTSSITKVGEGFAKKAGEELFTVIQKKFEGDKEGQNILSDFQKKPVRYQSALIDILKEKIEDDKSFKYEIRNIVEKNSTNISGSTLTATAIGNNIGQALGPNSIASVNTSPDEESSGLFGLFKKSRRK